MAHTPGRWEIRDHTVGHPPRRAWVEINAPVDGGRMEHPICRIPSGFTNQDEDARLISAAPDLLEACRAALAAFGDAKFRPGAMSEKDADRFAAVLQLSAAIEKATGEPPTPSSA